MTTIVVSIDPGSLITKLCYSNKILLVKQRLLR